MKNTIFLLALALAGVASAQTYTYVSGNLDSYDNLESEYQGRNPNDTGGDDIYYTYSNHKSLPQKITSPMPGNASNGPAWSKPFTPLQNAYIQVSYAIQNYDVPPQKQVVIYVSWTEQLGSEHWTSETNGNFGKYDRSRDWVDTAVPSIKLLGINDSLGTYSNRPHQP